MLARNPKTGALLWTSDRIGQVNWGSPIFVNGALYMIDYASILYKFALPAPLDIIFANGFDG